MVSFVKSNFFIHESLFVTIAYEKASVMEHEPLGLHCYFRHSFERRRELSRRICLSYFFLWVAHMT